VRRGELHRPPRKQKLGSRVSLHQKKERQAIHPLYRLFPNPTVLDLLVLFYLHPGREFYQAELVERTGRSLLQVQRALVRIEDGGLATKTRRGNRVYYAIERRHPAFEDLKRVLLKTVALGDALREALAPVADRIRLAFIFGSFAAGKESLASDVDLMIAGELTSRETAALLAQAGRDLGREFNPVIYPPEEFRRKIAARDPFLKEVLQGPKIWLKGDEEELEGMVG
jgi:predicted nucleotidyltransferase